MAAWRRVKKGWTWRLAAGGEDGCVGTEEAEVVVMAAKLTVEAVSAVAVVARGGVTLPQHIWALGRGASQWCVRELPRFRADVIRKRKN